MHKLKFCSSHAAAHVACSLYLCTDQSTLQLTINWSVQNCFAVFLMFPEWIYDVCFSAGSAYACDICLN